MKKFLCWLRGHKWHYSCCWTVNLRERDGRDSCLRVLAGRQCRCGKSQQLVWHGGPLWIDKWAVNNPPAFSEQRLAYLECHIKDIEADYKFMVTQQELRRESSQETP